jgi:hypothetical protein
MIYSSLVQLAVVEFARNVALPTLHRQRSHLSSTHSAPYIAHCSSVQLFDFWHSKLVNVSDFPRRISKDAVTVFPLIQTTRHRQYQTKPIFNLKAIYMCVNRRNINLSSLRAMVTSNTLILGVYTQEPKDCHIMWYFESGSSKYDMFILYKHPVWLV